MSRSSRNFATGSSYSSIRTTICPVFDFFAAAWRNLPNFPAAVPVRGGTDGSQLSFRGLLCPNLGTGGYAFHGPYEHITAEDMDTMVEILLNIVAGGKD